MKTLQGISSVVLLVLLLVLSACYQREDAKATQTEETPRSIIGKDGAKMALIPAGEFQMGTDPAEIPGLIQWLKKLYPDLEVKASWFENETPRHMVYLDAFYMDEHEVTNAQYRKFVQATGYREPEGLGFEKVEGGYGIRPGFEPWSDKNYNGDDQPVVCVTWADAKAYAEWAGKRLPTEAEWEKAARGGLVEKRFPWGDDWPPPPKAGNFADETFKKTFPEALIIPGYDDGHTYPAPVGRFRPNGYGLYDMAGNVWEWCADWYDSGYYASSLKQNPTGPGSGTFRVLRGGSWSRDAHYLRAAYRSPGGPADSYNRLGFRCVVVSQD